MGAPITTEMAAGHLGRRRLGHGRGARVKFERDEVAFVGGVRHGPTPPKWVRAMAADPSTRRCRRAWRATRG